jgi:dephospho-CoA kinase
MSITVAVTGGIGAGKSTVTALLAERGAVVVDSDRLAREVVGSGTPGLAAIAERFGTGVISADGSLDRPALAAIVFADPVSRKALEGITHPLVRARFAQLQADAPVGSVVVNDIPLLTTADAAAAFHLVIGVGAPEDVRIRRLVGRGLAAADARARIAAQIDDEARQALCDVWVDNGATPEHTRGQALPLWSRLAGFAANHRAGRAAARGGPVLVPYDPQWPATARRLIARVHAAVGDHRVDHIGSTAVPGLASKDVIDLQLTVADLAQAEVFAPLLTAAGFPRLPDYTRDTPHDFRYDRDGHHETHPDDWRRAFHANSDPGQSINLHLRVRDSPNWAWSLRFRDWLRSDAGARSDYLALKEQTELVHGQDAGVDGYADAKEDFLARSDARIGAWADSVGWSPG